MHTIQWLQRWILTRKRVRQPRYLCMTSVERLMLLLGALLLLGLWQASTLNIPHPCAGCEASVVPTGWAAARSMIASRGPWPCSRAAGMKRRSFSVTPCSNYPPSPCTRRRMGRPTGAVRPIRRDAARMSPPARRRAVSFTRWGCKATAGPHDRAGGLLL